MTCVECRAIRAEQMKELLCDNKENCREAYQDGYNQALEDLSDCSDDCSRAKLVGLLMILLNSKKIK